MSFEFPSGWTVTSDLKGPTNIDYRDRNGLANRCSKVLLWLAAPDRTDDKFSSVATLLLIDPACLSGPPFPQTVGESKKVRKVAEKIAKVFGDTPFISPFGNEVHPFDFQGHVTLHLAGGLIINAAQGKPAAKKEPLEVHTSFTLWELKGYWVAWAFFADDSSSATLAKAKVVFKNSSSPQER